MERKGWISSPPLVCAIVIHYTCVMSTLHLLLHLLFFFDWFFLGARLQNACGGETGIWNKVPEDDDKI